jgi:predicted TIM-barrel fold metal-dependent hydrolase
MRLPAAVHSASSENPVLRMSRRLWIAYCVDTKVGTVQRTMCELIAGAVPQEFPNLNFIMVEGGIGWVAGALQIMDHRWNDHRGWVEPKLIEPPSFYAKRQFYYTFEDDRPGLLTRYLLNVDRLMWGSDYPHTEGTFPFSRQQIAKDFADIPADETHKMVAANAARLFGI